MEYNVDVLLGQMYKHEEVGRDLVALACHRKFPARAPKKEGFVPAPRAAHVGCRNKQSVFDRLVVAHVQGSFFVGSAPIHQPHANLLQVLKNA